jgi:chorismate mutase
VSEPVPRVPAQSADPVVRQLREQVSDNDRRIVEAVNTRLKLVTGMKRYKAARGLAFLDPEREEWMLRYLERANRGPLSPEGLKEIFAALLELTKRELADLDGQSAGGDRGLPPKASSRRRSS